MDHHLVTSPLGSRPHPHPHPRASSSQPLSRTRSNLNSPRLPAGDVQHRPFPTSRPPLPASPSSAQPSAPNPGGPRLRRTTGLAAGRLPCSCTRGSLRPRHSHSSAESPQHPTLALWAPGSALVMRVCPPQPESPRRPGTEPCVCLPQCLGEGRAHSSHSTNVYGMKSRRRGQGGGGGWGRGFHCSLKKPNLGTRSPRAPMSEHAEPESAVTWVSGPPV